MDSPELVTIAAPKTFLEGLILDQCVQMNAALATLLAVQVEMLAHQTGNEFAKVMTHYVGILNDNLADQGNKVNQSIAAAQVLNHNDSTEN
jgi:hypothetical protein